MLDKVFIKNNKGSSLVSVVFIIAGMLILSSTLLLITANNSKFSKMVISKFDNYYDLEIEAQKLLKEIDTKMEVIENESLNYLDSKRYEEERYSNNDLDLSKQLYFNKKYKEIQTTKDLDKFLDDAFGQLYYIKLQEKFKNKESNVKNINKKQITTEFWIEEKKSYKDINMNSEWEDFKAKEDYVTFNIKVKDDKGNALNIVAKSKVPVCDTRKDIKYTSALKANPVCANAITSKGVIIFSKGTVNIKGDLFSLGDTVEDSTVNVYGNVYSKGDIYIQKGKVNIYKDSGIARRNKSFIYDDERYLQLDDFYYEDWQLKNIPLKFKDNIGGNLYCDAVTNEASINVSEVFWRNREGKITGKDNTNNKITIDARDSIYKKIFESKTTKFGTKDKEFDSSIDISILKDKVEEETGIKFLKSGGNLNITGSQEGIIYSNGDLNITGEGTLKGVIICNGNINIKGNVNIEYDENVIKEILKKHKNAREFFKPGETGKYCITMDTKDGNNELMKKISSATYKITEWKKTVEK